MTRPRIPALASALFFSLAVTLASGQPKPIDLVPQYGGMDRSAIPELKAGDEQLIEGTTKAFGSREKASAAFSRRGRALYQEDKNDQAMRRFNQAWLLDPNNFEVYWGFGLILFDAGKHDEALKWLQKSHSINPDHPEVRADLAFLNSVAATGRDVSASGKQAYFDRSNELFERFEASNKDHPYLYYVWARALAIQARYSLAQAKLDRYKQLGGDIRDAALEKGLREGVKEEASSGTSTRR